jgi:cellulose synthase (UDP-forming)
MCGTNMIIRRKALEEIGGMNQTNIAEDFATSISIHSRGWHSMYVGSVLAEGLAPHDLSSYVKQQARWARGSLEILLTDNPLFKRGLTWHQKVEYLSSASYHLSGIIVLIDAIFPLIFFFTNQVPFIVPTMFLAAVFLPYIFMMIYLLQRSSNFSYTFRALAFSMSLFPVHIMAFIATILRKRTAFSITPKTEQQENFLYLAIPHMLYMVAVMTGIIYAINREGWTASVINNMAWALFNVSAFIPFIIAAIPKKYSSESLLLNRPAERIANSRLKNDINHGEIRT